MTTARTDRRHAQLPAGGGAEHIGFVGTDGILIGGADERLRCQVKNNFRLVLQIVSGRWSSSPSSPMTDFMSRATSATAKRRAKCAAEERAHQVSAELLQPVRHPAAFKSGVPGKKNFAALPERIHHSFHGAEPVPQRSSRNFRSCSVSIGCQKPWSVGRDLTFAAQGFEWIALPDGGVALNVGSDFGRENEEPAADPATVALGFF